MDVIGSYWHRELVSARVVHDLNIRVEAEILEGNNIAKCERMTRWFREYDKDVVTKANLA